MIDFPCLIQSCWIGLRFLRRKCNPWITLAISSLQLLFVSGVNRSREKVRWMGAVSKIDFAEFYGLLNDLLW